MNRVNLDSRTIGIFDTIGSYFIDQFYNAHYIMAKELVSQGRAQSITDTYRANVINYMRGISRNDLYLNVIKKLHQYYQKAADFGSVLFHDFENKVLEQFIPPEYYKHFDERQKDTTLKVIITKCVQDLGEFVITPPTLKRIIDDHMNKHNIVILQDKVIDNFIIQRENYYADFADKINESKKTVNKKVLDQLKEEYVNEKRRSCSLEDDRSRAIEIIRQLTQKLTNYEAEIASLKNQISELRSPPAPIKPTTHHTTSARPDDVRKPTATPRKNDPPTRPADSSDSDSEDDEKQHQKQRDEMLRRAEANKSEKTNENLEPKENTDPDLSGLMDDPWEENGKN